MLELRKRELQVVYLLFGTPYVYRCSLCGKMFVQGTVEGVENHAEAVRNDFHSHSCWVAVVLGSSRAA